MTGWQIVKRVIDVTLAGAGLIFLCPVLLLAAFLVLILEGWPVFYVSRRHVTPDRTIRVFKFRSMVRDACSPRYRLEERFMRNGFLDIPLSCEVYTPIGRLLERSQIVELPQLLNVLLDGMSLIGNRALPPRNVELLRQNYATAMSRFDAPVGISGVAQIVGKLNLQPEDRLALELGYANLYRHGSTARCDLLVLTVTIRVILGGPGITLDEARWMLRPAAPDTLPLARSARPFGQL